MLVFSVPALPFLALSACNFVLSWLWYSPLLFAKPWMRALGNDERHAMTDEEKKKMPLLFLSGIASSVAYVYGLLFVVENLGIHGFIQGSLVGGLLWLFFCLTHSLNTLWEGRRPIVLLINNGLFLCTYLLFGGISAVWK